MESSTAGSPRQLLAGTCSIVWSVCRFARNLLELDDGPALNVDAVLGAATPAVRA